MRREQRRLTEISGEVEAIEMPAQKEIAKLTYNDLFVSSFDVDAVVSLQLRSDRAATPSFLVDRLPRTTSNSSPPPICTKRIVRLRFFSRKK